MHFLKFPDLHLGPFRGSENVGEALARGHDNTVARRGDLLDWCDRVHRRRRVRAEMVRGLS